jgi:hypothetical protein
MATPTPPSASERLRRIIRRDRDADIVMLPPLKAEPCRARMCVIPNSGEAVHEPTTPTTVAPTVCLLSLENFRRRIKRVPDLIRAIRSAWGPIAV